MLSTCQKALDTAMLRVCGSTENCDDIVVDNGAGTRSFKYEVCKYNIKNDNTLDEQYCRDSVDGFTKEEIKDNTKPLIGKLSGLVYWGNIGYKEADRTDRTDYETTTKIAFTTEQEYLDKLREQEVTLLEEDKKAIHERVFGTEISALTSAVENAINAIESDQTVQYCMTGREFQGMNNKMLGGRSKTNPRFPNLTRQIRQMIANSALKNARENYMKKYDTEIERMMKDQVKVAQTIDEENAKAKAVEMCIAYGESGSLPTTEGPKASNAGKWVVAGLLIAAGVALAVFTGGSSLGISVAGVTILETTMSVGVAAGIAVGAAGAAVGISAANNPVAGGGESIEKCENTTDANGNKVVGCSVSGQWNYKEKIVTIPKYETGECIKMKTTQNCEKTKKDFCDEWAEEVEEAPVTINLLN